MVAAMVEQRATMAASETVVFDYYCPVCRSGYLGSLRFCVDALPPPAMIHKRGHCEGCRKWRWIDATDGVVRGDGWSGRR